MKKTIFLVAMFAILSSNAAFAKPIDKKAPPCPPASEEMAWGIGLVGLAVIGVVAGLTASMASGSSN